jgi:hypothetical protein
VGRVDLAAPCDHVRGSKRRRRVRQSRR